MVIRGVAGWAICGSTNGVGRQVISMDTTLLIHAVVAPLAFGLLTWDWFKRFPASSAAGAALTMMGIVVALDALVVAPLFERSYAIFRSIIGTWVPLASILASSYLWGALPGQRLELEEAEHTAPPNTPFDLSAGTNPLPDMKPCPAHRRLTA